MKSMACSYVLPQLLTYISAGEVKKYPMTFNTL